ncbi:DUF1284 domain-containing protein [Peptoniphilus catoniae]|uniref:DUF1284 domain-containing protein n=1 Tax=Peptoniphilus catoniae TaxID=1660341 RepID=UPI0010FE1ED7|nr:DUF1284 domain-containing protein [Peptoniphilus catoniae]
MIKIRAHHLLCTSYFVGEGYNNEFSKNMASILKKLEENPQVEIINSLDNICRACPENKNGICQSLEKVSSYDKKVLELTGLEPGEIKPWLELKKIALENIIILGRREEICWDCIWNELCLKVHSEIFKA